MKHHNKNIDMMSNDVIKVKAFFNSTNMVTYVDPNITLEKLNKEVSELWQFSSDQMFTMKWIDDEGDPCLLSCQDELEEMLRLHDRANSKEPEIILHVFKNQPMMPGMPCPVNVARDFPSKVYSRRQCLSFPKPKSHTTWLETQMVTRPRTREASSHQGIEKLYMILMSQRFQLQDR